MTTLDHSCADAMRPERADDFKGDDQALVASIDALLSFDDAKALVPHGLGGPGSHAYRLLCAARHRLAALPSAGLTSGEGIVEQAAISLIVDLCGAGASQSETNLRVVEDHLRRFARSLAASPSNHAGSVGEAVRFAEDVKAELIERAPAYSIQSVERLHFDRAILAIAGLLRIIQPIDSRAAAADQEHGA